MLVAGSVGPTGELLEPLGTMTEDDATAAFAEQVSGLRDGGADIAWIETKSARGRDAGRRHGRRSSAACRTRSPASFDTAGRTMMGLAPSELADVFDGLDVQPAAIGANCGVGASDLLVAIQQIRHDGGVVIAKSNCGIPQLRRHRDRLLRRPGS